MYKSVLVVCSGNICRSPYAEYVLKKLCPELEVASAGLIVNISHLEDKPADRTASQVAAESGIDLSKHRARQLTEQIIDEYDVVLLMERKQLDELCQRYPFASYKAFLFSQWVGAMDIEDPYRKNELIFRLVFSEIDDAAREWLRRL